MSIATIVWNLIYCSPGTFRAAFAMKMSDFLFMFGHKAGAYLRTFVVASG